MEGDIRVVLIARETLLRQSLLWVLAQQPRIVVVSDAVDIQALLEANGQLQVDVMLIHLAHTTHQEIRHLRHLCEAFPKARLLVMGPATSASEVLACIEAGAAGYCSQDGSLAELLQSIQAVAAGEPICSPTVTGQLFTWLVDQARQRERWHRPDVVRLTQREHQISVLLAEGYSNKEIAVQLHIEVQTVKNHVHNILRKLQVPGRREAARYASEHGWLQWEARKQS